jgi:predicted O-methyltransferase YrrM
MELAQIELLKIAEGFFDAHVLFALNRLGVFDAVAGGAKTAAEIGQAVGVREEPLARLLCAGTAIRVLVNEHGRFSPGPVAGPLLDRKADGYLGNWLRLLERWATLFPELADSVRRGRAAQDPAAHLGADPAYTREFLAAMEDYARSRGREVVDFLPLEGARRLLDLGGGSGAYSMLLARRWTELAITVLDLPQAAAMARANVAAAGLGHRIEVRAGDYHHDDLGGPWDVVFASDILHQEGPDGCLRLLRRAHGALRPGGLLAVQGMFPGVARAGQRWPAMHSLIMLLISEEGRAYSVDELSAMIFECGFSACRHIPLSLLNVNSLLLAERPA